MPEEKQLPSWRKRFLANRMTFESILFEKELVVRERESLGAGLAGAFAIGLLASLLTAQWALRRGYLFTAADSAGFQMASACLDHFRSGGAWNIFKPLSGGFGVPVVAPLYYLTYVPVLKFITGNLNWAMLLVNSFYLTGLALAVFIAIKKNRNNKSGWLGACFAMAMPFVLEAARHPDHRLAAMALAAAAYAAFINSEGFEYPFWNFWCGVFFGLGFFADTMFWVYALPLVPFMVSGLMGQMSGGSIIRGLLPGAVLVLPWYAFAFVSRAFISGAAAPEVSRPGVWLYLVSLSGAVGLPLFTLGAAALLWMYFSVFMPYSSKKIVAAWFWVPFVIVYFLFNGRTEYLYPALLPMAVAVAVMTPGKVRKYVMGLALVFLLVNQSGFVGPVSLGRARLAGLPRPSGAQYRAPELMAELKSRAAGSKISTVALVGEDENFNHAGFNYLSEKMGRPPMKFAVYQSGMLGLADFVVHKTAASGAAGSYGSDALAREIYAFFHPATPDQRSAALAREISRPWFAKVFSRAASFDLPDTSRLVLYARNPAAGSPFPEGKYPVKKMNFGGVFMADGSVELSGFDPSRGVYAKAVFYSPYALLEGFDIYGLIIEITDFSGLSETGDISDLRVTGAGTVRIVSAKITNYAFERYLAGKYGGLEKIEVKLDKTIQVWGEHKGREVHWELSLSGRPQEPKLRLENFSYGGYKVPAFLLEVFDFKYDLSGLPYDIRFNRVKLKDQMLEIS